MVQISDAIGNWYHIGTLPASDSWQLFTEGAINGRTFRLTYLTNWEDWELPSGYKSFGLLRFYYRSGSGQFDIVSPSLRLWPKREAEIREIIIPSELQSSTYVMRVPGIRRVKQRQGLNNLPSSPNMLEWSLKLEYLL